MTSEAQWAWVAGIIEGEGWLNARDGGITVQMTDKDVVEKLFSTTGMGTLIGARPTANGTKPRFTWNVYQCTEAISVCTQIMPWLGVRRRAKALEVIARASKKIPRNKYVLQNRSRSATADSWSRVRRTDDGLRVVNQALSAGPQPPADNRAGVPGPDPAH